MKTEKDDPVDYKIIEKIQNFFRSRKRLIREVKRYDDGTIKEIDLNRHCESKEDFEEYKRILEDQ